MQTSLATSSYGPHLYHGVWQFPVHHVRGGTSTGAIIWEPWMPSSIALREELLRHLMGVSLNGNTPGNRQLTGLGRGPATSNKVFLAHIETTSDGSTRLVSTLAQLAADHGRIDWSVNCGNMSAALQTWALDMGFIEADGSGWHTLDIRNINTGSLTTSRMAIDPDGTFVKASIPGVLGTFPAVDLFLLDPVGAKTGSLLPTGSVVDVIDGYHVSCVDAAVPMVIASAREFGKTAHEPVTELVSDTAFLRQANAVWIEAGLRMGLRHPDGSLMSRNAIVQSETIPKFCIVGEPRHGGDIAVRYFTPQTIHATMAVSGGCCLAVATLIPGSVAYHFASKSATQHLRDINVVIEHPAGLLETVVQARSSEHNPTIAMVAYRRSAQILMKGHVPLYNASRELQSALEQARHAPL
ncbi:PrpF domain-containing protein [Paraburkholderia humisilvae]|uniref:4-oxalomesaconate tautomerase n=1 Tax=Paraburkholderia humisilvae TaxID=627669 RepID=A0A6J5F8Y2_9BURK|nr:PrpF domain-containing protein [Paraburkholderia humisilvae]CAB3774231.1 4-oxalomesaconate tautomerase [Paraburkholderia humisilvae]